MGGYELNYDKVIIGAGLYGLYTAAYCAKKGEHVLVLECDSEVFGRATYINQARVHMGYHYPRSYSTAIKSAYYFDRFNEDFDFCIKKDFRQIYATSKAFSWTNKDQFLSFCDSANIRCEPIEPGSFFKTGMCDGAFNTQEYTYDAMILKDHYLKKITKYNNLTIKYNAQIHDVKRAKSLYSIKLTSGEEFLTNYLINTTYASVNQIINKLGFEPFTIKYELCEIILCKVSDRLKNIGITVMDGPFFSVMPFGQTGLHSLTSVAFTPHMVSYDTLPVFPCQKDSVGFCSPEQLGNCNNCPAKPKSAWPYMCNLARKYLRDDLEMEFASSLFSMKPIMKASEIDDSRPTVIKQFSEDPIFISILSGKINTVYDLEGVL